MQIQLLIYYTVAINFTGDLQSVDTVAVVVCG